MSLPQEGGRSTKTIVQNISQLVSGLSLPRVEFIDVIQILIIAVLIYYCIVWIKQTRAYALLKGIAVLIIFTTIAYLFNMTTIIWISKNVATVAITAVLIVFQPELRKALEQIGQKRYVSSILNIQKESDHILSDAMVSAITRAAFDMGASKTGALIVIEKSINLQEYINTGIPLNADITSELILNIFEHNTPLHDGAVIIREGRIVSATCYLPLSEREISKKLGTRHRAGLGISEVSDSLTVIVSEETGRVSIATGGEIKQVASPGGLREHLYDLKRNIVPETRKFKLWKGRDAYEKKAD